jgi:magnesium transporter
VDDQLARSSGTGPEEPLLPGVIDSYLLRDFPDCAPGDRAAAVRAGLVGRSFESVDDVAVCEPGPGGRRLRGLIPMERLLAAGEDVLAGELMDADPPVVAPGLSQEQAAWKAVRHGETSLAVVDAEGHLQGLVPPRLLLGALLRDHDRDFARLGGYLASTESARHAAEEALPLRLWHRFPWLLLGLAGAALSAWLVGGFEAQIATDVRLAFFVPGVVYLADAVGTQTEALVIRGLSVGASMSKAFRLEALTGVVVGLLLGVLSFSAVWAVMGSFELALAVALALFAACGVATVVAGALPWILFRRGKDPAFGSGPLATVVQDLLSLVAYFAIAVPIVQ